MNDLEIPESLLFIGFPGFLFLTGGRMEAFFHKIGIFFLGKKNTFMGMLVSPPTPVDPQNDTPAERLDRR
jgi:hypothetical protein